MPSSMARRSWSFQGGGCCCIALWSGTVIPVQSRRCASLEEPQINRFAFDHTIADPIAPSRWMRGRPLAAPPPGYALITAQTRRRPDQKAADAHACWSGLRLSARPALRSSDRSPFAVRQLSFIVSKEGR